MNLFNPLNTLTYSDNNKNIILDKDILGKSINEIKQLENKDNKFKLSSDSLQDAFKENDKEKIKYLTTKFGLKMQPMPCNLFVDSALEDGKDEMTKFLISEFKCEPSLYAKQMAQINGHHSLALWTEVYGKLRNNTDIKSVHYNHKLNSWNSVIPEEYRY